MILIKKADDATAAGISWNDHLSEFLMLFAALYQYIGGGGFDLPCHRKIIYENRFYSSMIDSSYKIKYLKRYIEKAKTVFENRVSVRLTFLIHFWGYVANLYRFTNYFISRNAFPIHHSRYSYDLNLPLEEKKQFSCFIFRWHRISTAPPPNYHPTYTSPEHTNSLWFDPIR